MNAKEKAKELYNKMYLAVPADPLQEDNEHKAAKQCALIAVEEILYTFVIGDNEILFWVEVKQEIKNYEE